MQVKSKKLIAVFLSIALLFSCLVAFPAFAETESVTAWDGTADSELEGSGSDIDPFLISNAGELYYAVTTTKGYYFKLTQDIIINDITVKIENGVGVVYNADGTAALDATALAALNPWIDKGYADSATRFKGTLDGDGHIIRGLYLDSEAGGTGSGDDYKYARALIPYAKTGTVIKNLGLEDAYISYKDGTASGFIGNVQSAEVSAENCYVGASAYFYGHNASAFFGGGNQDKKASSVKNGYSQATLKVMEGVTDTRFGTIFADAWYNGSATAENFYTTTKLTHSGVVRVANVYDYVSAKDGYIGTAFDGNTFLPSDAFAAVEGELPTLKVFRNLDNDMWGGLGDSELEGSGTSSDPYLISNGEELAYVMANNGKLEISGEYFELTNDIYLNNVFAENWKESADNNLWYSPADSTAFKTMAFVGNLDGNGYCIYGIWNPADSTAYASGLVPGASGVTIKNLGIKESQIAAAYYAGGIVGYCSGGATTISGCFSDNTVDVIHTDKSINGGAGGIVGYNMNGSKSQYLTVKNCYSLANCTSANSQDARANGLFGTLWSGAHKVIDSYAFGNAPYLADSAQRVSTLAVDATFVKYTDADGNEISGVPTDQSTYKKVYVDYTETYTWNANTSKYKSSRTYTGYSTLTDAYSNVYGNVKKNAASDGQGNRSYNVLSDEMMTGEKAVENMKLDGDIWYSVKDSGIAPMLRIHGTAIGDVNEDGLGLAEGDDEALRLGLIGSATALNGDYNRDGAKDITDLVSLVNDTNTFDDARCVHVYKETVLVESTPTEDGINEFVCRRCGHSYTENIGTSIKLLAIGSSHTMNSITFFGDVCEAAGIDNVYLGHMYKGGVTFQQQYEDATGIDTDGDGNTSHTFSYRTYKNSKWSAYTSGKHVAEVVKSDEWDYIVLNQGAIDAPLYGQTLANGESFDTYETYFDWEIDYIRGLAPDATLCWNMTFACEEYEEGDPRVDSCDLRGQYKKWFNFDSSLMFEGIVGALNKYVLPEEEIEILFPSATTIENIRTSYKGHTLTNDLTHLDDDSENLHGRYAVALTWYKALTGADLSEFNWVPADNLTDDLPMIIDSVNNAIADPLVTTQSTYTVAP